MQGALGALVLYLTVGLARSQVSECSETTGDVYGFSAPALDGSGDIVLGDYAGGTWTNFRNMNALIEQLDAPEDFVVLGFPCNQFDQQEPALNEEIMNCLEYVRPGEGFVPLFQLTEKLNVNGDDEHPLWTFLKGVCPNPSEVLGQRSLFRWETLKQSDITWNFEKFLIDREGKPYRRYDPSSDPLDLEDDILDLIGGTKKKKVGEKEVHVEKEVKSAKLPKGHKVDVPRQKYHYSPSLAELFSRGRKLPNY